MAYLLAVASAALYGTGDFFGGLASRRASTVVVVAIGQCAGLILPVIILALAPAADPLPRDFIWGGAAGLFGGVGVALLYRALAIGTMAIVAPTTAVCAVAIPVIAGVLLGERPPPMAVGGIALAIVAIVLVSQQRSAPAPADAQTGNAAGQARGLPAGLMLALLSGVAIGSFFLSLARTRPDAGLWPLLSARTLSVAFFAAIALTRGSLNRSGNVGGLIP